MLTLDDEDDILDDVEDAVSIALDRLAIEGGYVDDIKLNKLAYFLIQEEHLNITYGWYKYGPAPYDVDDSTRGQTTFVSPEPPDRIAASDTSSLPDRGEKYKSPEDWSFYFSDEIRDQFIDIVTSDTKEYLIRFYDSYAPREYRELYKKSARFQLVIDEIKDDPDWYEESDEFYSKAKERGYELYREMLSVDHMEETVTPFHDYLNLLEDTIIGVGEKDEISEAQNEEVTNVINFFYGAAWEWPALLISWRTVRGDNKRILQRSIDNKLNEHRDGYIREVGGLKNKVRQRNLLPEHVEELDSIQDEDRVIPPSRPDDDEIKSWTSLGVRTLNDARSE